MQEQCSHRLEREVPAVVVAAIEALNVSLLVCIQEIGRGKEVVKGMLWNVDVFETRIGKLQRARGQ